MGKETVISRLQKMLIASKVHEIIVVTGADAEQITPHLLNHKKIKHVHNKNYILGQTSSFQAGLTEVCPSSTGLMLLPIDFPLVKTQSIDFLIEKFSQNPDKILIPSFDSRNGHPPIFPSDLRNEFLALKPSEGLNVIQQRYPERVKLIEVSDKTVTQSFNTPPELKDLMSC
jgi:CTP:molybdopterin cytidylyltransferase MocA